MLDCVLISRDEAFRRQVAELAHRPDVHLRVALDLTNSADELPREAVGQILSADPQVAFIDLGDTSTTGLRVMKVLSQDAPDMTLIVAGPALGAEALLEVMRSGAAEYLPRPLDPGDVASAFERVRRRLAPSSAEAPTTRGRLISVFSAKGGTGVTTVAANLASFLASHTNERTLLLDLNSQLGTAALVLGLRPRYSYLDVVQNFHRMDAELLESFLEIDSSGVSVLSSPTLVTSGSRPSAEQMLGLVRLCQRHFSFVVVDAGSDMNPGVTEVLRESEERLLVSTPELPTLRNLKRALELIRSSATNGAGPAKVVLNQFRDGTGVSGREVAEALGTKVFATLEWDGESVIQSLNLGQPAVRGRSRFAKAMSKMGRRLAGSAGNPEAKSGILPFIQSLREKRSGK